MANHDHHVYQVLGSAPSLVVSNLYKDAHRPYDCDVPAGRTRTVRGSLMVEHPIQTNGHLQAIPVGSLLSNRKLRLIAYKWLKQKMKISCSNLDISSYQKF